MDDGHQAMPGKAQPKYALRVLIAAILGKQEGEVVHVRELAGGGAQAMLADGRKMKFTERQLFDAACHLDLREEARVHANRLARGGSPKGERLTSPLPLEGERPAALRGKGGKRA